jgi:DNA-binding XRE family transcriptional regulator
MVHTPLVVLFGRARMRLGWTQRELGENLGSSHRTATRWEGGKSAIGAADAAALAKHVYPVDRELAEELLAATGQSLVGLGIEAAPAPSVPPPPPPPPPRAPTSYADLIDCVVCSVADAANVSPRAVRPLVLLTLRRALEVGLDLEASDEAGLLQASTVSVAPTEPAGEPELLKPL